ncbi:MAG: hypothetical protein JO077_15460 [Verrucomicrobia bacterium]|nr:hypothetical protein [Verrucomicrobiota bacterium]
MRVWTLYRTLALGILRGLSEFCGKRDAASDAAEEEKTGIAAKNAKNAEKADSLGRGPLGIHG